jgi:hypothetical protein
LAILAIVGVVLSVALTLFGFAETTPGQVIALELSALPLSVSLAAGDMILLQRADRTPTRRTRIVLASGAAISTVGLLLMALAYLTGPRDMVQFGQFLVFVGLLVVLLSAIGLQRSPSSGWFHLEPVDDSEETESARLPEAADPDRRASL